MTSNGIANTPSRFHSAGRLGDRNGRVGRKEEDSDGGEEAQNKCVCCMQWFCCGCGLVAWSHLVRGLEGAAQLFIILMIRAPVQCVCTLDSYNFV